MASGDRPFRIYNAHEISPYLRKGNERYIKEVLSGLNPLTFNAAASVTALPTAAITQVDKVITLPRMICLADLYQSTEQTLLPLGVATGGLNLSCDQVNNEEVQYVFGGNSVLNPWGCTMGTDPNWFYRWKLTIADVSGSDQTMFGVIKQAAFQASPEFAADGLYTDFALIGNVSGNVVIYTDLNNSGVAVVHDTGFNWLDTLTHTLELRILGRRAYWLINGVMLGQKISKDGNGASITAQDTLTPPAFTFDTGDFLVPYGDIRHDAVAPGIITLVEYEFGPLCVIGKDQDVYDRAS